MMNKTFTIPIVFLLVACSPRMDESHKPLENGIEVQVLIGPMCPVIQEGTDCPDQPYQAMFTILDSKGREVYQFKTDEQGRYKAYLDPGRYTLRPEPSNGMVPPIAAEQEFTVEAFEFTQIVVKYDSGIR